MKEFLSNNAIGFFALAVSLVTLYISYLSPFSLSVTNAGRISLTKDPNTLGLTHAMFFVDLLFSNTGSRKGVVEDVALKINDHGRQLVFPAKFYNSDRQLNLTDGLPPPKFETFIGFNLQGSESVVRQIGFAQEAGEDPFSYQIGTYLAEIYVFSSDTRKWIKESKFSFDIEQSDLDQLSKMKAVPQPQGGFFINMVLQDKKTNESEDRIKKLKN